MTNESKTLFIPLYGKALMSERGFFSDKTAEEIVASCGQAFSAVDKSEKLAVYMAMRAMQFDGLCEKFLEKHPDSVVIHLGCGLDSRCRRVSRTPKMWYDLDLPEVIELRKAYYSEGGSYRMVASSVTELGWLDRIEYSGESVLIIAEGLTMYLTEEDMVRLMEGFRQKFGKCVFLFDAYSDAAARLSKFKNPINAVNAKISFSMSKPQKLEQLVNGAECFIDSDIIQPKYISRLSGAWKARFKFMGKFGSSFYRIYGYKIIDNS